MSDLAVKTFDAVEMVRAIRDELSAKIAKMSVEEENQWLRSAKLSDPKLRRLMERAEKNRNPIAGSSVK